MINKFGALLLIGMASPYQILDWYGGRHTASGALVVKHDNSRTAALSLMKFCMIEHDNH